VFSLHVSRILVILGYEIISHFLDGIRKPNGETLFTIIANGRTLTVDDQMCKGFLVDCADTCVISIHCFASSTVLNSTNAIPRDESKFSDRSRYKMFSSKIVECFDRFVTILW